MSLCFHSRAILYKADFSCVIIERIHVFPFLSIHVYASCCSRGFCSQHNLFPLLMLQLFPGFGELLELRHIKRSATHIHKLMVISIIQVLCFLQHRLLVTFRMHPSVAVSQPPTLSARPVAAVIVNVIVIIGYHDSPTYPHKLAQFCEYKLRDTCRSPLRQLADTVRRRDEPTYHLYRIIHYTQPDRPTTPSCRSSHPNKTKVFYYLRCALFHSNGKNC